MLTSHIHKILYASVYFLFSPPVTHAYVHTFLLCRYANRFVLHFYYVHMLIGLYVLHDVVWLPKRAVLCTSRPTPLQVADNLIPMQQA